MTVKKIGLLKMQAEGLIIGKLELLKKVFSLHVAENQFQKVS